MSKIKRGKKTWSVGELAKETGITVRTLHHYEEVSLLKPSSRTESAHRVYSENDVQRLQGILSLKQLGFSLEEIRSWLDEKSISPLQIVRMHRTRLIEEKARMGKLLDQLSVLERTLEGHSQPSVQELFKTIEEITVFEKYFSPEQLKEIESKRQSFTDAEMKQYSEEWSDLTEKVRSAMKKGTEPFSPEVQQYAVKLNQFVKQFSGGNPHIEVQLGEMYRKEPDMRKNAGMDPELWDYVGKMMTYYHKLKK